MEYYKKVNIEQELLTANEIAIEYDLKRNKYRNRYDGPKVAGLIRKYIVNNIKDYEPIYRKDNGRINQVYPVSLYEDALRWEEIKDFVYEI